MNTPKTVEEVVEEFEEVGLVLVDDNGEGIKTYIGGASEEQINWLRTTLLAQNQAADERLREAVKEVYGHFSWCKECAEGPNCSEALAIAAKHGITNL